MKEINELKEKIDKKDRKMSDKFKYLGLSILSVILFIMLLTQSHHSDSGILLIIDLVLTTFLLTIINWWYLNRLKVYKEEEANRYTLVKHIKNNGVVLEGKVVHIKEEKYYFYSNDEEVELTSRELVLEFEENGEKKYIIKSGFPHEVTFINADKDDVSEIYKDSEENIEKFKENCINIYQYKDKDGSISFTNLTGEMTMVNYADSVEKNYVGDYTCRIYSYKGRYVIGDVEGYDYEAEKLKKQQIANEEKIQKRKEIVIYIILISLLLMIFSGL